MKKTIAIVLIVAAALISGISGAYAQQQTPQPQQGGMMHQGMMCPMMAKMTQGGTGQSMMMCPMMQNNGSMMMHGGHKGHSAPQTQTDPPAPKSN
jgi:hypothetical protein